MGQIVEYLENMT